MELARGVAARIVGPFIKGGIRDIRTFWPLPCDKKQPETQKEEMTEEEKGEAKRKIKELAERWLKE